MADILLDTATHDIKLTMRDGSLDIDLTADEEAVAQDWKIRLWTFRGEAFNDQRVGIPYFQNILVKNPDMSLVNAIFTGATLSTAGVSKVFSSTFDFNVAERRLNVSMDVILEEGIAGPEKTFTFVFDELILPYAGNQENA